MRIFGLILLGMLSGCGSVTPDGDCLDDFDCEPDQVCGSDGICLLCDNCHRGVVGTCLVPAYPQPRPPDSVRLESRSDRDCLIYVYRCDGNFTEYRYDRLNDRRCFDPNFRVEEDGCGLES
jgi:hypothetical protein